MGKTLDSTKERYEINKIVQNLLLGSMSPSEVPMRIARKIISEPKMLSRIGYKNHTLGYILAIADCDWMQQELLSNALSYEFKAAPCGRTIAHIIAENPYSDAIRERILRDRDICKIKDDNNLSVRDSIAFYSEEHKNIANGLIRR